VVSLCWSCICATYAAGLVLAVHTAFDRRLTGCQHILCVGTQFCCFTAQQVIGFRVQILSSGFGTKLSRRPAYMRCSWLTVAVQQALLGLYLLRGSCSEPRCYKPARQTSVT
jgi:hypothetical protein